MKLRLFVVYPTDGVREYVDIDLAILSEHDCYEWIGNLPPSQTVLLKTLDKAYRECKRKSNDTSKEYDPYIAMFEAGGSICTDEIIHIIGDFDSIEELKEWIQMQYLLDSINIESLKTLDK